MFYQNIRHRKSKWRSLGCTYSTVIKHSGHLRTLETCRKHLACVIYISLTFYNACCVLLQCNTRLRVLYLLKKIWKKVSHSTLLPVGKSLSVRQNKYQSQSNDCNKTILGDLGSAREKTFYFHWYPDFFPGQCHLSSQELLTGLQGQSKIKKKSHAYSDTTGICQ